LDRVPRKEEGEAQSSNVRKRLRMIKTRIGSDAPLVPLFYQAYSFGEACVDAEILLHLGLEGPMNPHHLWRSIREHSCILSERLPDRKTIDRHIEEMTRRGYVEVLKAETNPINPNLKIKTFDLTIRGVVAALAIKFTRERLEDFLRWKMKNGEQRVFAGGPERIFAKHKLPSLARYMVREVNHQILLLDIDTLENAQIREIQEHSKTMHIIKLIQCVKDGKLDGKLLGVIPISEAKEFKKALEHDLELRIEWKEVMRNFRVSVESLATGISSTVDETEKWFDSLGRYSVKRTL
jgi:hypothetical protein